MSKTDPSLMVSWMIRQVIAVAGHLYQLTVILCCLAFVTGSSSLADGSYNLGGLSSGSYYVYARATGYGGLYYDGSYNDTGASLVSVTEPGTTAGINFQLSPEGSISSSPALSARGVFVGSDDGYVYGFGFKETEE